jgi:hypothetical protein
MRGNGDRRSVELAVRRCVVALVMKAKSIAHAPRGDRATPTACRRLARQGGAVVVRRGLGLALDDFRSQC